MGILNAQIRHLPVTECRGELDPDLPSLHEGVMLGCTVGFWVHICHDKPMFLLQRAQVQCQRQPAGSKSPGR